MEAMCQYIGKFPGFNHEGGLLQGPSVTNDFASVPDQLSNITGHDNSLVVSDKKYALPPKFNTVKYMLNHWSTDVGIKDLSNDMKW